MASYQVLYWKDIPLQVRARDGSDRISLPLSERFQEAVDQAAMLAGLTGSEAYTDLLQWTEPQEKPGTANEVAHSVAAELESAFSTIDWRRTAAALRHGR